MRHIHKKDTRRHGGDAERTYERYQALERERKTLELQERNGRDKRLKMAVEFKESLR